MELNWNVEDYFVAIKINKFSLTKLILCKFQMKIVEKTVNYSEHETETTISSFLAKIS